MALKEGKYLKHTLVDAIYDELPFNFFRVVLVDDIRELCRLFTAIRRSTIALTGDYELCNWRLHEN